MIIDCHTHWGMNWEEASPGDPRQWLSVLDRHSVDRCFFMPHAGIVRSDLCERDNNRLAKMSLKFPKRLLAVGSAWPQLGKKGVAEVRRCINKLHVKGLKFHPWLQGFSTADPHLGQMCALAGEAQIPVFFHDGTPCYSLSEQIGGLARHYPKTQFVLAHSGLLWNWRSALAASRLLNVWLCLCGPHLRMIEMVIELGPTDRLVWGSDFGAGTADQIEYRLNLVRRARMPEGVLEQILGLNALRLANV